MRVASTSRIELLPRFPSKELSADTHEARIERYLHVLCYIQDFKEKKKNGCKTSFL